MTKARNLSLLSAVEAAATADQTKADLNAIGVSGGRKNLIINGGMDVWQRGTSFTSSGSGTYIADRWYCYSSIESATRVLLSETNQYGLAISNTSNSSLTIGQKIEDVSIVSGKALTVSFKGKSTTSQQIRVYGYYYDTSGSLITSGSIGTVTLSTSLTDYAVSFTAPDLSASSIKGTTSYMLLRFDTTAVNTTNYTLTELQLELGSVATDFEHRSYGEELALCQRYFEWVCQAGDSIGGSEGWSGGSYVPYKLQVEKRASPTITPLGSAYIFDAGGAHLYNTIGTGAIGVRSGELWLAGTPRDGFVRSNTATVSSSAEL